MSSSSISGVPGVDFGIEDIRGEFPESIHISPLESPPDTEVAVPGSKSVTNRAILIAALAEGDSTLRNPLLSEDSFWMMNALGQTGIPIHLHENRETHLIISGQSGIIPKWRTDWRTDRTGGGVFVGNSGTTARFLTPALGLGDGEYRVDGVARMRERPMADLVGAMRDLGIGVEYVDADGRLPIVVRGGGIGGGRVRVEGGKSSQFVSGVMISAPYARDEVAVEVAGGNVRQSYVGITRNVMESFGITVRHDPENNRYTIPTGIYRGRTYDIEPDASGASYFFAAAALTGGRVRIPGLGKHTTQGDMRFVEVLAEMGCGVEISEEYTEVRGPEKLRGVTVDMNDFSDTMITLAAIAPFAEGKTRIENVAHSRLQETDRIHAVATELTKLGIEVEEFADGLEIHPGPLKTQKMPIDTYDDHRIAMAFSLIGLVEPGIEILNPSCVAKTMPDYFQRIQMLGT